MSKISELSDGGSLVSSDYLIAVRSGGNVKVRMDQINVDQIDLGDNEFIRLGNSQDLTIVHDASNSIINQAGIGDLLIQKAGSTKASFTTNGLEFPDSSKAIFGAGSDLQIYHDGSNSYIDEAGTGTLYVRADSATTIANPSNTLSARFRPSTSVSLYYNGVEKLATTATGVDITGTATMDGLTVNPTTSAEISGAVSGSYVLKLDNTHATSGNGLRIETPSTASNEYSLVVKSNNGSNNNLVVANNGDISFYEDTGTTPKFFWDASAESLGVGTSSPAQPIEILKTSAGAVVPMLQLRNGSSSAGTGTSIKFMHSTVSNATSGTCELESIRYSGNLGALTFKTSNNGGTVTERMRVNDTGVGIGTDSPDSGYKLDVAGNVVFGDGGGFDMNVDGSRWQFSLGGSEKMRIDGASGNLLVGKTSTTFSVAGVENRADGRITSTRSGNTNLLLNRLSSDGDIVQFYKDGTVVGSIGTANSGDLYIGNDDTTLLFAGGSDAIIPRGTAGASRDAAIDLGSSNHRFKDLYRSGSTISTSDRNMKQDERDLTEAETRVAQACKGLLKAFRFIDAVQVDGDGARIHFGIVAQDLQAAFEAEGLDATNYAMFRPSTSTDENGNEHTRLGVCYENLLAFIIAAI